jgi:hypothetical protein
MSKEEPATARLDHRPHADGLCRDTFARSRRRGDHRRHARHGQLQQGRGTRNRSPRTVRRSHRERIATRRRDIRSRHPRRTGTLGTSGGLAVSRGDRPTCTVVGLTLAPPKHTAILSDILQRERARAFIPDYRLAPEYPFPAATGDMLACYQGLAERDVRSYGRLHCRQSGTRTRVARYRRSRLHQRDSCRSCRVVAGYRPNPFGHDLRDARGCRSSF